ncbi:PREDICTED: putative ribonuclease H protein At1g65750-like [Fragaria vesca subsp. vesca]
MVSEGFNLLDRKIVDGNVGIKVDIAKAFDTLNWQFLIEVLHRFGFGSRFTDLMLILLNSAHLSILINGSPHGFFSCTKGVRQGDPLSPILFCIAEEALSRGLTALFSSKKVRSISLPRGCSLTHVLYADDLFIFCRGDTKSLRQLQSFLDNYGAASGQLVNKDKSTFYLGASHFHRRHQVKKILGFKLGTSPFSYLGVPIFKGKPCRKHLQALVDKAKARLAGWKGKLLSMAGRVQLVHDVFQSMLLHSFSIYLWATSLLSHLSACARNFIWSGDLAIRKLVTISWQQVCTPRNEAGLDLRNLKALYTAGLISLAWQTLLQSSSWGSFACRRFTIFRHMKFQYFTSSVWHGLKRVLPLLFEHSRWIIGDGNSILFWSDKWLHSSIIQQLNMGSLSHLLNSRVADFIWDQQWALPSHFSNLFPDCAKQILEIPLPNTPESDILIWEHSSSGIFSFSDGYELVRPYFEKLDWASSVWHSFIPPRYSVLAWRIFHLKLPTDDQLQRRGIPFVSVCQLCSFSHTEDIPHLFVNCSFAQHIWQWLAYYFGTSLPSSGSLNDLWSSVTGKAFSPQLKNIWFASCLFALMAIWKSHNKLRFDNKQPSLMRVFRSVKAWVRYIAPYTPGCVRGVLDSKVLSSMGVILVLKCQSALRIVLWHPPLIPWLKLNTNGFSKGNPGLAGCGGVFRDSFGRLIGGYCQGLGTQTTFFVELMTVILGVEFAFHFGWHHIWLESDSTTILQCISSSSFAPPWSQRIA